MAGGQTHAMTRRLERLDEQWHTFADDPEMRILREVVRQDEVRMVEIFVEGEMHDERRPGHGRSGVPTPLVPMFRPMAMSQWHDRRSASAIHPRLRGSGPDRRGSAAFGLPNSNAATGSSEGRVARAPGLATAGEGLSVTMIAAKHFDPVVGIDIHIVQPPGPVPPIPVPHPFVGMLIDPMDYVPILGSTVSINGVPRCTAGSAGNCIPPHIPIGGVPVKPAASDCEVFMGSSTVLAEDEPLSSLGMPVLSCSDVGMPPPPRPKKKSPPTSMYLPTSVVLSVPMGMPVLVGGPPTISMMAMAMKAAMSGLGKLRKLQKGSKRIKALSKKIQKKAGKAMDKLGVPPNIQKKVHKGICTVTGHPVDVATGKAFTEATDFRISGPIPLSWERDWYSSDSYMGPLGYGWHHKYDYALCEFGEGLAVRKGDGRAVAFPILRDGQRHFDRRERLTLFRDVQGYAVREASGLVRRFGSQNRQGIQPMVSIEKPGGARLSLDHDGDGRLISIVDACGRKFNFKNDVDGRILAIDGPDPDNPGARATLVSYGYDRFGNLLEVRDALGHATRYRYVDRLMVQETDRTGLSFYFEYDGAQTGARCVHTWGDRGIYDHRLFYDDQAGTTEVVNSLGHSNTYSRNEAGVIIKVEDARGNTSSSEYDENHQVVAETDALGRVTSFEYDVRGNPTRIVGANGAGVELAYNDSDCLVRAADPSGGWWVWHYDGHGRLIERVACDGGRTHFHYEGAYLDSVTMAGGQLTRFGYDDRGMLNAVQTADGATSQWVFDPLGRGVAVTDPRGNLQHRRFDKLGQLLRVQDPDGNVRELSYDGEGNVVRTKDAQHDVKLTYAGMGRLSTRTEANTTVRFEYNTEEQLVSITNEHGRVYGFELDELGDVVTESGFDHIRRRYLRDEAGQVLEVLRPDERVSSYGYDDMGRIVSVSHSDGSAEAFNYDLAGQLLVASNRDGEVRLERDAMGRVVREWQDEHWVQSNYDSSGRRVRIRSSYGADQKFERNAMGDVVEVQYLDHQSTNEVVEEPARAMWEAHFERDLMGQEIERRLPGGVRSRWARDGLGRPQQHQLWDGTVVQRDVRYKWGIHERLEKIVDGGRGMECSFGHDEVGNLAWAQYSDGKIDLRMPDAVGNLFKREDRGDRKYGPAGQLLETATDAGVVRYRYDAEGNLVEKKEPGAKVWRYEWTWAGQLKGVERPDKKTIEFKYDALGRRVAKVFDNTTTRFMWDGNNPLHEWNEGDAGSAPTPQQRSGQDERVEKIDAILAGRPMRGPSRLAVPEFEAVAEGLTTWLFDAESFAPCAKVVGGVGYSIVTDDLGVPVAMLDGAGTKVWSAEIDVFGRLRMLEVIEGFDAGSCPFRWPGQYEDVETGLYYNRFRYYDPEAGQYVSQDPLRLVLGISLSRYATSGDFAAIALDVMRGSDAALYRYVFDPTVWSDPLGLVRIHTENGVEVNAYPGPPGGKEHLPLHCHVNQAGEVETRVLMQDYYKKGSLVASTGDVYPGDPALSRKAKKVIKKNLDELAEQTESVFRSGGC